MKCPVQSPLTKFLPSKGPNIIILEFLPSKLETLKMTGEGIRFWKKGENSSLYYIF